MLDKAGGGDTHFKLLSGCGLEEIKRVMDCHSGLSAYDWGPASEGKEQTTLWRG